MGNNNRRLDRVRILMHLPVGERACFWGIRNWDCYGNIPSESYLYTSQQPIRLFVTRGWGNPCIGPRNPGLGYTRRVAGMLGGPLMTGGKKTPKSRPSNSSVCFHSNFSLVLRAAVLLDPIPRPIQLLIRCRTRDPFVMASKPARSPNKDELGNGDCSPRGPPPPGEHGN